MFGPQQILNIPFKKIGLFVAAILMASPLIIGWSTWNNLKALQNNNIVHAEKLLSHAAHEIFSHNEYVLKLIMMANGEQLLTKEAMEPVLKKSVAENPHLIQISVVLPGGDVLASSDPSIHGNVLDIPGTETIFREARSQKGLITAPTFFHAAQKSWVMPIALPYRDSVGKVRAFLFSYIPVDNKQDTWYALSLPENMEALILRPDGATLLAFSSKRPGTENYRPLLSPEEVAPILRNSNAGQMFEITASAGRETYLAKASFLKESGNISLIVVSKWQLFRDWVASLWLPLGVFSLVIIAGAVLLFYTREAKKAFDLRVGRLLSAIRKSPAAMVIINEDGQAEYSNQKAVDTGLCSEAGELLWSNLIVGVDSWDALNHDNAWRGEVATTTNDTERHLLYSIAALDEKNGGYILTAEDITSRKNMEVQLENQARYDSLTGLPNRLHASEKLKTVLDEAQRTNSGVGVLFLDVDNFKRVNDTFGHDTGDAFLYKCSERIRSSLRGSDFVARLSGDEFLVVLPDIQSADDAAHIAQRIVSSFEIPTTIGDTQGDHEIFSTVSIGIAVYPNDGEEVLHLLKNADSAMYRSKENGKGSYCFFSRHLHDLELARFKMETQMRAALRQQEFFLEYQMQFDALTKKVIGAEALLRWENQELGRVSPVQFIPVAEDTGIIIELGDFVINQVCHDIPIFKDLFGDIKVAVNISPRQLRRGDILHTIRGGLNKYHATPQSLEVEITESIFIDTASVALSTLKELRSWGVKVAVDDFGTGFSSLNYLRKYPVSSIKIDRSFIKDVDTDSENATLTKTIIAMGHALNLEVVAEGVETEAHLEFLQKNRCDVIQGFLFHKPQKLSEIIRTEQEREAV